MEDIRLVTLPVVNHNEEAYEEAKEYLIKELAFIRIAHLLLGVPQLVAIYHRPWPVLNSFLAIFFLYPRWALLSPLLRHCTSRQVYATTMANMKVPMSRTCDFHMICMFLITDLFMERSHLPPYAHRHIVCF
jgi:hypothetical protein